VAYGTLENGKRLVAASPGSREAKSQLRWSSINLGVDYWKVGDKKAANAQYEKLRTLNPNNAKALYQ
jgi:hypothetical protein